MDNSRSIQKIPISTINGIAKLIFVLLTMSIFHSNILAQNRYLKISNQKKEILLKETRSIRLVTNGGKKISGRFLIVNEKTITVKENIIQLTEIARIKKKSIARKHYNRFLNALWIICCDRFHRNCNKLECCSPYFIHSISYLHCCKITKYYK